MELRDIDGSDIDDGAETDMELRDTDSAETWS